MAQEVKVTQAMHRTFEHSEVSPFVRHIPEGRQMRIQTATRVRMVCGRVDRWLDNAEHVRPMTAQELAVCAFDPMAHEAVVPDEGAQTAQADQWWEEMQAQRAEDAARLSEMTTAIAGRAAAEAGRRLDTATCGIERCESPVACTDEQEALCEWSIGPAALGMTAAQRFANRSDRCPRRLLQIQRRRENLPMDTLLARGRAAHIPEEYLAAFSAADYKPELRRAFHAVRAFAANRAQQFLILLGTNQCGKSYAASRWLWNQETGLFLSQDDLDLAMRPGDTTGFERLAHSAKCLVLDNLESSMSPALRRRVEGLVIRYKQEGWRMIMTSSMDPAVFLSCMKAEGATTGPAFARLSNGIAQGTTVLVECPAW